ncbi:MAG: dTDP-glucose 4,6-dehydratase [Rhodothermaceae bacterium]|nr:dTDP-glucose 4,6-dehydratase [Rhodothermaceae bacterium]
MQHNPKRILVTGGAGFIGSNFLLRMVPRYPDVQFWNLDQLTYAGNLLNLSSIEHAENYTFIHSDITDLDKLNSLFEAHDFTTVIHFAAESHVDRSILGPVVFAETNTVGTLKLLEAARRHWGASASNFTDGSRRFYHVSTDEVYGSLSEEGYFTEQTPYDPRSPYSASKAASDHFVRAYYHTYKLPFVISNCSNNYGPYQFPEKLIPLVILNAIQGKPIPIYGKGENVRDWLHVGDHCEAIDTILRYASTGHTYNIGGGNEHSNLELVGMLLDEVDKARGQEAGHSRSLITFVTDRPGHDFRYAMDYSLLNKDLGWEPAYSLAEGLQDTVLWYLNNQKWLEAVADQSYREYYTRQYASR